MHGPLSKQKQPGGAKTIWTWFYATVWTGVWTGFYTANKPRVHGLFPVRKRTWLHGPLSDRKRTHVWSCTYGPLPVRKQPTMRS
jgi:hypothetical protein